MALPEYVSMTWCLPALLKICQRIFRKLYLLSMLPFFSWSFNWIFVRFSTLFSVSLFLLHLFFSLCFIVGNFLSLVYEMHFFLLCFYYLFNSRNSIWVYFFQVYVVIFILFVLLSYLKLILDILNMLLPIMRFYIHKHFILTDNSAT